MLIDLILGARPNFIKISSIINAINELDDSKTRLSYRLVHTGQHFDKNRSEFFFDDLGLPQPDIYLHCGGGTHAEQTAKIMIEYEKVLVDSPIDLVLVVGDVNSTMACAIVAKKLQFKVAHVESGIRSYDRSMPEEINRIITDSITDFFFTTSENANANLISIGIKPEKIFLVGNTMVDTLINYRDKFRNPSFWDELELSPKSYFVLTIHRPANLSDEELFLSILKVICINSEQFKIIFPAHPRTSRILENKKFSLPNLHIVKPLSYLEFNYLVENSMGVITDSGGISEETMILDIPCITLRNTTERPETVDVGTNVLVGNSTKKLEANIKKIISGNWKKSQIPQLWDGNTGRRIIKVIQEIGGI